MSHIDDATTTHFAPAARATGEEIVRQHESVLMHLGNDSLIDHSPHLAMVLNPQRQIIYANRACLEALGIPDVSYVLDRRPGEALRCIHSEACVGGCGTSTACSQCGAVLAIMAAMQNKTRQARECLVTTRRDDGYAENSEFQVVAEPVRFGDDEFVFLTVSDISDMKRRVHLENVFMHDLRNLTTALSGHLEMLQDSPDTLKTRLPSMTALMRGLVDTLESQQILNLAERGSLLTTPCLANIGNVVNDVVSIARTWSMSATRSVEVTMPTEPVAIRVDKTILQRVMVNMVKNALEATESRGRVQITVERMTGGIEISVHNASFIPEDIQPRIFTRYFSTKSPHRGLGTYGMRILTERYMAGCIGFTTSATAGTRFYVRLPSNPD